MTRNSLPDMIARLGVVGITPDDAAALRRIAMTLHRWQEAECGNGFGAIERDEATGRPYWHNAMSGRRTPVPDREGGALRRLALVMKAYPALTTYIQGDCRGAPLYILRPGDVPEGKHAESYYNRGLAVYGP